MSVAARIATFVVVLVAILGARFVFGIALGDPCSDAFLCNALPARCVLDAADAGFCSRPCQSASECPDGWSCEPVSRVLHDGTVLEQEPLCIPPARDATQLRTLRR